MKTNNKSSFRYFWSSFSNSRTNVTCLFTYKCTEYWYRISSNTRVSFIISHSPSIFLLIEYRSKAPLMPLGFLRRGSIFGANAVGLLQVGPFVGMVFILTNYLQQARGYSALSCWPCIYPNGYCISSRFWIFVSAISKSLRCQTNLNFRDGFADNWLYSSFTDLSHRKLLWRIARTNAPHRSWNWVSFTAINIAALTGTRRGEEGLASGLINTSRQIGGPIGLAVLLTVANFETPHPPGQLAIRSSQ